jgi:hypothetical protein
MKDQTDSNTVDMFPVKRGPGRPKSGAVSSADRQRAYRQRKAAGLVKSAESLPSVSAVLATSELDDLRSLNRYLENQLAELRQRLEAQRNQISALVDERDALLMRVR